MIKKAFTDIGKIDKFNEYKRYSLYMKGLILICTFCVYVSIILGLSIWGVSLTHLVYKIFSIVKSGSFLVSEIVITIIVYIGFTLGVSYISMFIGSKFISLIDNIKIKECIKFNYTQCVKEKRGEKIKMEISIDTPTFIIIILIHLITVLLGIYGIMMANSIKIILIIVLYIIFISLVYGILLYPYIKIKK